MYIPAAFHEADPAKLHEFIEHNSFALLVNHSAGELTASHLPLLLDRASGPHGRLHGHMARANPQWRHADGTEALAIFSGPHAYISPTWYEAAQVVPTWNYVAVHAYGTLHVVEDPDALIEILRASVSFYEGHRPRPWQLESGDFLNRMVQGIVGFRIEITRLEGKWKLGQNHPPERREKVVRALSDTADENARAIAALMKGTLGQP